MAFHQALLLANYWPAKRKQAMMMQAMMPQVTYLLVTKTQEVILMVTIPIPANHLEHHEY
jgi:hypothetical protein